MMDITINYKNAVDFMDNKHVMKMILNCAIENNSDVFNGVMMFKKIKKYDAFDKYFKFALICKGKAKKTIGFILEKTYFEKPIIVWTMDTIYIIPDERMKGYCYQTLLQYSKLQRAVIANSVISATILKINMREGDMFYQPNIDLSNLENLKKTFVNKDSTFNYLSRGLVEDYYQSKCQAHQP